MTKNFIICFIIAFFTLLNEKKVLSQENGEANLSQEKVEASDSICEIASREIDLNTYGGKLSDYWAQEYIGSDLFREEFSDWLEENPPPENLIAVLDSFPIHHGVSVTNLISHQEKQSVLPSLRIRNFWVKGISNGYNIWNDRDEVGEIGETSNLSVVSNLLASQLPFSFINNSLVWISPADYLSYKRMSDRGSIIVSASGNDFPHKLNPAKEKGGENLNTIFVGSLRPSGLTSDFSQESKWVSILAPSNHEILSIDENGRQTIFGGTSGAAPLVTGSLAAFEWITNYHPTIDELKLILKKTAIPSLMSHQEPKENGDGIVNAYKIARVAKRIFLSCQDEDSQKRVTCIQENIKRNETYQFSEFSRNDLTGTLNEHFPECVSELELGEPKGSPNIVCENKKEALKRLRKEAFLNPYNKDLWRALSCIYKKEDFLFNSIHYNITALATEHPIDRDKVLSTVKEAISFRKENFLEFFSNQNLNEKYLTQIREENLLFELKVMFRIFSSFFPEKTVDFLKEKLQFFKSYKYVNKYAKLSLQPKHLALVMFFSGLLKQEEGRAFFQDEGFSKKISEDVETSNPDSKENSSENHLNVCDLIALYKREKRGEEVSSINIKYHYNDKVRIGLIKSSVFLENENEKWRLLKRGLEDESLYVRKVAIKHFSTLEDDESKLRILNCLESLENGERDLENFYEETIRISTSLKDEKKRENFFKRILSDENQSPLLKSLIIKEALWSLNEEIRSELLKAYFNSEDLILKKAIIASLWMLDDQSEIKEFLNAALKDKDSGVRSEAFLSIGHLIHDKNKIPLIEAALKDDDPEIQALSMEMIWSLEEPSLVEKYFDLGFHHSEPEVRIKALQQVPYFNKSRQEIMDLFTVASRDSDSRVRQLARSLYFYGFTKPYLPQTGHL